MAKSGCRKYLPVFSCAERVQFTRATHGNDQEEATHQASHCGCCDDLARQDDGAVELVCAVLAVNLSVAAPALKDTSADRSKGSIVLKCKIKLKKEKKNNVEHHNKY